MTITRRSFLTTSAAALAAPTLVARSQPGAATLTASERVERALAGRELDRPPISLWHHFGLEKEGPERHARATLDFHRQFGTDLVKVMSDFPYPRPSGQWFELKEVASPFPAQLRALALIRDGLGGRAPFVETIFNPWNVAEKLASPAEVKRLQAEQPQRLLDALEVIARSEANHAKLALETGAVGIFLAIANAQPGVLAPADYARFSEPFDRLVLEAAKNARLNVLHLHGDQVYLDRFYTGWPASTINYSQHGTGVSLSAARAKYSGVLMGGIDETHYRTLDAAALRAQADEARKTAGARFILAPGCSVPDASTVAELRRLRELFPA